MTHPGTRMVRIINDRGIHRIHMRACHMAQRGGAQDWPHGNGRSGRQLAIDAARLGFRPCRVCRPFPKPDPEQLPGYVRPGRVVVECGRVLGEVSGT
jgi:hypothetical protein